MEFFQHEHMLKILNNKFIIVIGDSVQRSVYKDLVCLLNRNSMLSQQELRAKGENSHCGDELIEWSGKTAGKWYREVRQYQTDFHLVRYYFVTCCYSDYMETILLDLSKEPAPDVVLMNSTIWDISRYGPTGMKRYKDNLQVLFSRMDDVLPKNCLFIWLTSMPVATKITAPFITPALSFLEDILTITVREGNFYATQVAEEYGSDVIDLSWLFRNQTHLRVADGVHWDKVGHRRITNSIMTHLCKAWKILLPSYFKNKEMPVLLPGRRKHVRSNSMFDTRVFDTGEDNNNLCCHGDKNNNAPNFMAPPLNVDNSQQSFLDQSHVIDQVIHGVQDYTQTMCTEFTEDGNYWPQNEAQGPMRSDYRYGYEQGFIRDQQWHQFR